jgi:hypothetical protein
LTNASIKLEPTIIPEWDAEDKTSGVLDFGIVERADERTAKEILDEIRIDLPKSLDKDML